jgi:hypothetical protein
MLAPAPISSGSSTHRWWSRTYGLTPEYADADIGALIQIRPHA